MRICGDTQLTSGQKAAIGLGLTAVGVVALGIFVKTRGAGRPSGDVSMLARGGGASITKEGVDALMEALSPAELEQFEAAMEAWGMIETFETFDLIKGSVEGSGSWGINEWMGWLEEVRMTPSHGLSARINAFVEMGEVPLYDTAEALTFGTRTMIQQAVRRGRGELKVALRALSPKAKEVYTLATKLFRQQYVHQVAGGQVSAMALGTLNGTAGFGPKELDRLFSSEYGAVWKQLSASQKEYFYAQLAEDWMGVPSEDVFDLWAPPSGKMMLDPELAWELPSICDAHNRVKFFEELEKLKGLAPQGSEYWNAHSWGDWLEQIRRHPMHPGHKHLAPWEGWDDPVYLLTNGATGSCPLFERMQEAKAELAELSAGLTAGQWKIAQADMAWWDLANILQAMFRIVDLLKAPW